VEPLSVHKGRVSLHSPLRYYLEVQDVAAFVLAGGKSSRMGVDKAFLPFGDRDFLQLALSNVATVSSFPPTIVGSDERYAAYGSVVGDKVRDCGPLGGIHAALSATKSERNLILSVDMPLMQAAFLGWLVALAAQGSELISVPHVGGRTQPLCAVYHRSVLPEIETLLLSGRRRVDFLLSAVRTRMVTDSEIVAAGFSPEIFQNVNTREEYEALLERYSSLAILKGHPA
jgi:molybdopterin-guanine dinucleotide biosynthesis protein A